MSVGNIDSSEDAYSFWQRLKRDIFVVRYPCKDKAS
jgi:hypothetical protein